MGIPLSTFEPNLSEYGKLSAKAENLENLVGLVKVGKLKTVVDSKHPLSNVEGAWSKGMDGHATGKLIVEFLYVKLCEHAMQIATGEAGEVVGDGPGVKIFKVATMLSFAEVENLRVQNFGMVGKCAEGI
ncbi:hypothetical protein IFM89_030555 [Coptis chinensis]|uniref:Uncharacterized protein n=1 Tax=Coptis chinensis TaxID=261450 RepID=A0A835HQV7_9MAGN|nr:hypothetical protein IFM89_030555 [Coptis chinensis]